MKERTFIQSLTLVALAALLSMTAGCKHPVTDTNGPAHKKATQVPELPYIMEGDYTPDTGVMYKVLIDNDTCFVVVNEIVDSTIYGYYYQTDPSSEIVVRKEFHTNQHWKERRSEASVYVYQAPTYRPIVDDRYRKEIYSVVKKSDIEYGQALGYWTSKTGTDTIGYFEILTSGISNTLLKTTQSLTMDVYLPENSDSIRPMVLLLHGGAFYVGDKGDSAIAGWCQHLAALGYVAVSANYRLGFLPTKQEITRAGYAALQDAHAAMRYLVEHRGEYRIDTNQLFVGGASAGSITALNLAFMRDKDRPSAITARRWRDMGTIASSGNSSHTHFHIKAVINMWGAVNNLNILKNSSTNVISFHGDQDQVVPYDNGFPFNDMAIKIGQKLFDRMYGSVQIDKRIRELGRRSKFYTFPGEGHSLHHYSDGKWNQHNFELIRDRMSEFLYEEIVGPPATIVSDSLNSRHYYVDHKEVENVIWHVEGGLITKIGNNEIWVVWQSEKPVHRLSATGRYRNGFGFELTQKIDIDAKRKQTT